MLQKASSRSASRRGSWPLRKTAVTLWAPTGYPPKKPEISRASVPTGIPHSRPRGRKTGSATPERELVSRIDRTKKGNSDGTTVFRHSSMPSVPPASAVFPSKIRISIPKHAPRPAKSGFRFTFLTSEESMQDEPSQFIC